MDKEWESVYKVEAYWEMCPGMERHSTNKTKTITYLYFYFGSCDIEESVLAQSHFLQMTQFILLWENIIRTFIRGSWKSLEFNINKLCLKFKKTKFMVLGNQKEIEGDIELRQYSSGL